MEAVPGVAGVLVEYASGQPERELVHGCIGLRAHQDAPQLLLGGGLLPLGQLHGRCWAGIRLQAEESRGQGYNRACLACAWWSLHVQGGILSKALLCSHDSQLYMPMCERGQW